MRTISYRIGDLERATIHIGRVAENEYTRVQIDAGDIYAQYPHAAAALTVQPPAGEAYPAVVTRDGNLVIWDVPDSALTDEGLGEIQLTFTENGVVVKSAIGQISVCRSIIGEGDAPDPLEDFLAEAGAALTAIPETIDAALEAAKESGEFDGPAGPAGADGADGYSPSASVSKSGATATITITDQNGTTTAEVSDGQDGADGYSPTATVSKSGKTATITITDKNGTTTAQISDGEDGQGGDVIDDTSTALDKAWSASKVSGELSNLNSALSAKQDAPSATGTAGQVLGLDSNLDPVWVNQSGGGGTITDVQVNGTSVVTSGVANVPLMSTSEYGVAKANGNYGISIATSGAVAGSLVTNKSSSSDIKTGTNQYKPIVPSSQHESVFYALTKAAGEDLSNDTVTVGTYPEKSISAIHQMLDAPISVSGSTPSITAKPGVRYVCGEVSTLTIVVPASGIIDVTFESGSTATVLTVTPPTGVTMSWVGEDITNLEANKHYEINIMDGQYGMVVAWT